MATTHHLRAERQHARHLHSAAKLTVIASACLALSAVNAAPLTLAQVPAGNAGKAPAPNLIISVDDSGSMRATDGGGGLTRIAALRNALTASFSSSAVADDTIRLGFQAMWRCRGFGADLQNSYGATCPENRVRPFSGTHRTGFNTWVNSLTDYGWTPSHLTVRKAGEFLKTTGVWNPYAKVPGVTETPLLSCRKTFHIFMTDGDWNSTDGWSRDAGTSGYGNADGTTQTLPDGVVYDTSAANTQTRVYRDAFGDGGQYNTFADLAFHYWATDLQPSIPNEVAAVTRQAGPVDVGTTGNPYVIDEYWNPKNDPANWQHMVSYTIGFGPGAALSTHTTPKWGGGAWSGTDYTRLLTGAVGWNNPGEPNSYPDAKSKDLWHAALNGRGRYIPATNVTELSAAFAEIINQVIADSSTPLASIASNTQTVTAGTRVYTAGYDASKWNGNVQAFALQTNYNLGTAPLWNAATVLEGVLPSARLIYTHNGSTGTTFNWGNLSTSQQNLIKDTDTPAVGQTRLDYLRGTRTQEQSTGGVLRTRGSKLGDIVNSNLWVVGKPDIGYSANGYSNFRSAAFNRTTMIYVGANDGMLHGFNAADGSEKMAYVPQGVYSNLKSYTDPSYIHRYMVDGHPFTGDIYDDSAWKTMLVGSLAAGGKGYFVLDVTDPSAWGVASGPSLVVMDKTDGTDADIGHIFSEPTLDTNNSARAVQITKLNDDRWAVLMGNGANSTSEKAVLLVQYLDHAKELLKIELDGVGANGNGLSNPQVIDIDGDGKADVAYAGDLQGNLWKINLSSATPSNWKSFYMSGVTPAPLFVARDTSNARQPIVTAPQWATHPTKGLMIAFGTGREMSVTDRSTTSTQTLYAVWDNTEFKPKASPMMVGGTAITGGRGDLVAQTQTAAVTIAGKSYFKTSSNTVPYTGVGAKRGWYMDWPNAGERSVNNGGMLSNRLLYMRSKIPASGNQGATSTEETCDPVSTASAEYLTVLDIVNGTPPSQPVFDTDGGGMTGTEEAGVTRWMSGTGDRILFTTGKPGQLVSVGATSSGGGTTACTGANAQCIGVPQNLTSFGWRQLQ